MKKTIWKDIRGYEGFYQVSNTGLVRSMNRFVKHSRSNAQVLRKGRVLKQTTSVDGYLMVGLWKMGKSKTHTIHRLVVNSFIKELKKEEPVNHINGNKKDNTVENLEPTTLQENLLHFFHTHPKKFRIKEKEITMMKKLRKENTPYKKIAKIVGCCEATAFDYLNDRIVLKY